MFTLALRACLGFKKRPTFYLLLICLKQHTYVSHKSFKKTTLDTTVALTH